MVSSPPLCLVSVPRVHALPGTNHVIISDDASLDQARQHAYVDTIVDATVTHHLDRDDPIAIGMPAAQRPDEKLRHLPYCFVADTDSVEYIIDTGANRIIINNAKLFTSFRAIESSVKGIGGTAVKANGTGTMTEPSTMLL
jgi:hypothetical protein